ncbi:MAG: DUF2911 domain-containing protein [Ferruginibacter sp.]
MKKIVAIALFAGALMVSANTNAQTDDKAKRASPQVVATGKLSSGAKVKVDYSQPALKGRTIGKDLEPMDGKLWRTGANEATVLETDQDIMVMDQKLPAGKYALFTIFNGDDVTVIFNKTAKQWGAYDYKEADDAIRVKTKATVASPAAEKLTFKVSTNSIGFTWGNKKVDIPVK